jgi:hypothetical protein
MPESGYRERNQQPVIDELLDRVHELEGQNRPSPTRIGPFENRSPRRFVPPIGVALAGFSSSPSRWSWRCWYRPRFSTETGSASFCGRACWPSREPRCGSRPNVAGTDETVDDPQFAATFGATPDTGDAPAC